jgi:hypothetical protein
MKPLDPIAVDRHFQEVLAALSAPTSPIRRAKVIDRFLELIEEGAAAFESYVLDIAEILPEVVQALPAAGHDPDDLEVFTRRLVHLRTELPRLTSVKALFPALERLKLLHATALAYAGEIGAALRLFGITPSIPDFAAEGLSPFDSLRRAHADAIHRGADEAPILSRILLMWEDQLKEGTLGACVPVVEHLLGTSGTNDAIGEILRISCRVVSTIAEGDDDFPSNVQMLESPTRIWSPSFVPTRAARELINKTLPLLSKKHFSGRVTFRPPHLLQEGASTDLAIGTLVYIHALEHTDQRIAYHLLPTVAITGCLLPDGGVQAVDASAIPMKVRSVFFSAIESLVVPREQLELARSAVHDMRKSYPRRHLDIIGIDHLREMFFDLRIIRRSERSHLQQSARWLWRHRITAVAVLVALALVPFLASRLITSLDLRPVSGKYEGEYLFVRNAYGETIDRILLTQETAAAMSGGPFEDQTHRLFGFLDPEGKGAWETVYGEKPGSETGGTSQIIARGIRSDTVLWRISISQDVRFPRSADAPDGRYAIAHILVDPSTAQREASIFYVANNTFFPALLRRLDPRTGATIGTYVHVGHFASSLQFADVDRDGITEVLCCGINNAYRKAFVAVLDPAFLSGCSPARGKYIPDGISPGLEKYYVLIPETIVGRCFNSMRRSAAAVSLTVGEHYRRLMVQINDTPGVVDEGGRALDANFYIQFDQTMHPLGISTTDAYDLLADRLVEQGRLESFPELEYFDKYRTELLYWDGASWSTTPVMNSQYLEAVRAEREKQGAK